MAVHIKCLFVVTVNQCSGDRHKDVINGNWFSMASWHLGSDADVTVVSKRKDSTLIVVNPNYSYNEVDS